MTEQAATAIRDVMNEGVNWHLSNGYTQDEVKALILENVYVWRTNDNEGFVQTLEFRRLHTAQWIIVAVYQ